MLLQRRPPALKRWILSRTLTPAVKAGASTLKLAIFPQATCVAAQRSYLLRLTPNQSGASNPNPDCKHRPSAKAQGKIKVGAETMRVWIGSPALIRGEPE